MVQQFTPKAIRSFWQKIEPQTPCWLWKGARNTAGYGVAYDGHRTGMASRYIYQLVYGDIPQGFTIDHLCFNKSCVNPWHLEAVPIGENVRRGHSIERGRTTLLTQAQNKVDIPLIDYLLANRGKRKTFQTIGRELGISSSTIAYWCKKLKIPAKGIGAKYYSEIPGENYTKVAPSLVVELRTAHPDWTLQSIASAAGVSRERIRQVLKREGLATRRLRTQHTLVPINAPGREAVR